MRRFFLQQKDNRTEYIRKKLAEGGKLALDFEPNISKITKEDVVVVTPAFKWTLDIVKQIPQGTTVFGGMYKEEIGDAIKELNYHNFMADEDFVLKNATYTAEGFLVDLIANTKLSLFDQKIIVLGSGRVAKAIWLVLCKLGVHFDTSMRNEREINYAKLFSNNSFAIQNLKNIVKNYDTIINTIPFEIFEGVDFEDFKKDVKIFELASKKCLDKSKCPQIDYIFCPSLPSKYLGDSAGNLMWQYIKNLI